MKSVKYVADGRQVHTIIHGQLVHTDIFNNEVTARKFANLWNDPRIVPNEKQPH